ncbi:hypothetical protein N321_10008, partial [Antrostomus carolinensis]
MDLYVITRNIQLFRVGRGGWGDSRGLLFFVAFTFGEGLRRHDAPTR